MAGDCGADVRRRRRRRAHPLRRHPQLERRRQVRRLAAKPPGRGDIRAGHAVVDAPGQHARRLDVDAAPASGAPAALDIAGGWLDVAARLEVGERGTLALAGGRLAAGELDLERGALEVDVAQLSLGAVAVRGVARLGGALRVRARVAPHVGDSWTR